MIALLAPQLHVPEGCHRIPGVAHWHENIESLETAKTEELHFTHLKEVAFPTITDPAESTQSQVPVSFLQVTAALRQEQVVEFIFARVKKELLLH